MIDLICDVINYCARSCDVGEISLNDDIVIGKKLEIDEIFLHKFSSKI